MKILLYKSLFLITLSTLFSISKELVYANEIDDVNGTVFHLNRGPITDPDGGDLYPGGDNPVSNPNTLIVEDNFINWSSSFFTPQWFPGGNLPIMSNGYLYLPLNSVVNGNPLLLERNSTYRITLGNLQGTISFNIIDQINGLELTNDLIVKSEGNSVSFFYNHNDAFDWNRNSIITLSGASNATMDSFKIEKLP